MVYSILVKAKELYKKNWAPLLLYSLIYAVVLGALEIGLSRLPWDLPAKLLPDFLAMPLLLFVAKKCFENSVEKPIKVGAAAFKVYELAFWTALLPNLIRALLPAIPFYGLLMGLILNLLMYFVIAMCYLSYYIYMINPRIPVREMVKISCGRMKGNIASFILLNIALLIWLLPVQLVKLFVVGDSRILLECAVMVVYLPYYMSAVTEFGARLLSGLDAQMKIDVKGINFKHFFEDTLENGPEKPKDDVQINDDFIEEFKSVEVPTKRSKTKAAMEALKERRRKKKEEAMANGYDYDDYDDYDEDDWYPDEEWDEDFETPYDFKSLQYLRDYRKEGKVRVRRLENLNLEQEFCEMLPYDFLINSQELLRCFKETERQAREQFLRSGRRHRGSQLNTIQVGGNWFIWTVAYRAQGDLIEHRVQLGINNEEWIED